MGIRRGLSLEIERLHALVAGFDRQVVRRGEVLVREGESADRFFVVHAGRFAVLAAETGEPFAEIGQGELVGEIGFFADLPRTATVVAMRDSIVIEVDRARFREIADGVPSFRSVLIESLARRLAERRTSASDSRKRAPIRTVALLPAGGEPMCTPLVDALRRMLSDRGDAVFVTREGLAETVPSGRRDDHDVLDWLNELEARSRFVFYVADHKLNAWTQLSLRQADQVLLVATELGPPHLNDSERFAFTVHPPSARQLALVHRARTPTVRNTAAWLRGRNVSQHHHIALEDSADVERLCRFLSGRALGYVAGGGGSFGSAHIGVYEAFRDAGARFDYLGGTSAGAAMMAAIALGIDAEQIGWGVHNIFIRSRSFRRPTLPRYALLDHKAYDRALRAEYGDTCIEDLWRPFFAVSSNLSTNELHLHREGPVWQAVRASGSIPGLLPPLFTAAGDMLVDGAIMNNLPLEPMKQLKAGPNVVVRVGSSGPRKYPVDYDSIPGPAELARRMMNPFDRRALPAAPGMLQVIAQSMLAHRPMEHALGDEDVLVCPPIPSDLGFMDWSRHGAVAAGARAATAEWIAGRLAEGHGGLRAVFRGAG